MWQEGGWGSEVVHGFPTIGVAGIRGHILNSFHLGCLGGLSSPEACSGQISDSHFVVTVWTPRDQNEKIRVKPRRLYW
jgi:hypothetical protein